MPTLPPHANRLQNLRVLITRPMGDGQEEWKRAFAREGAIPILYPTIAIHPPRTWEPLNQAIEHLSTYDWLIFTSPTAIQFFIQQAPTGTLARAPRIVAVGPKTAEKIHLAGGKTHHIATDPNQEGLLEVLTQQESPARALFPQAETGRTMLATSLRKRGWAVDVVPVYRNLPIPSLPSPPPFDVAIFASPSAFHAFASSQNLAVLKGKIIAVIGKTTAKAVQGAGLAVRVAENPHAEGIIQVLMARDPMQGEP